jgi:hypothetical protein
MERTGIPTHIAICQFATAALVAAAEPADLAAVLHRLARIDVGGVSARVQEADVHRGRRRATGRAVADWEVHDGDDTAAFVPTVWKAIRVPRIADVGVRDS